MHPTVHDPQQYLTEARLGYLREQPEAARRDMPWVEGALKQHEAGRLKNFRELERGADRAGLVFLVVFLGIPIATELTTVLAPVVANHWEICVVGILVLLVVLLAAIFIGILVLLAALLAEIFIANANRRRRERASYGL